MKKFIVLALLITNIFANIIELDGVTESQNEKIISSKMMGYITKVNVNEGDSVKKEIFYTKLIQQELHMIVIF